MRTMFAGDVRSGIAGGSEGYAINAIMFNVFDSFFHDLDREQVPPSDFANPIEFVIAFSRSLKIP